MHFNYWLISKGNYYKSNKLLMKMWRNDLLLLYICWFIRIFVSLSPNAPVSRGELRLRLNLFTSELAAAQSILQHRRLLRILLDYEISIRKPLPHTWCDDFALEAQELLTQHAVQARLHRDDTGMCR